MPTFVIVHGAFGGGWEWTPVAEALRRRGHVVFTPTSTGMGERSHLGPEVGLDVHVEDLVAVLELEDLHDVVLCGASYGGMAVTAAADRVPDRIRLLVYVDALVPEDGQCGLDLLPDGFTEVVRAAAGAQGHGWVAVPDAILPPEGLVAEDVRARFVARLRPQPVATFTQPVRLSGAAASIPRAFIRCTGGQLDIGGDPIEPMARHARRAGWAYRELATPHDPHLFDPAGVAGLLHELAGDASSIPPPAAAGVLANEGLVGSAYDAQARGDLGAYLDLLSDDFVLHIPGRSRIAGDYAGRQEMLRHFAEIRALSGGTFRTEVHDVVAGEHHAVGLIGARAEKDGHMVELPRVHVWHVAGGQLRELWLHPLDQATFDDYWG